MPILVSPIDGKTPMQQIVRDGIEIDRCPVSGGVWLDRGELEKLLAAVQSASRHDRDEYFNYRHEKTHAGHRYDDDDYDDFYKKKYGKKSKMKTLFDIFD